MTALCPSCGFESAGRVRSGDECDNCGEALVCGTCDDLPLLCACPDPEEA